MNGFFKSRILDRQCSIPEILFRRDRDQKVRAMKAENDKSRSFLSLANIMELSRATGCRSVLGELAKTVAVFDSVNCSR